MRIEVRTPIDTIICGDCREEMKIKTITSIFDWQNDIIDVNPEYTIMRDVLSSLSPN